MALDIIGAGFGRTGTDSLRRAAILAMRDAAALIIMQMDKVSKIRDLADGPLDPETALRRASDKFAWRFRQVELRCLESGKAVMDVDADVLDWHWNEVKRQEEPHSTD